MVKEYNVFTFAGRFSFNQRSLGSEISAIITSAPSPAAILAALNPTIPPPNTRTFAGLTPGTPPNKIPTGMNYPSMKYLGDGQADYLLTMGDFWTNQF